MTNSSKSKLPTQADKLRARIEQAKRTSIELGFGWFIYNVFQRSFPEFISGSFLLEVAKHLDSNPYTMDVTGRTHFKSTRLYADVMYSLFTNDGSGFEAWYFSYAHELAAYHLTKLKNMIKANPYFSGIHDYKPTALSIIDYTWSENDRHMTVNPSGLLSFKRGIHAERIYVDDPLRDPENKLQPLAIYKINDIMKRELMPMVNKGGYCRIVGCVALDTLVQTRNGLVEIGNLFPGGTDFTQKQLIPHQMEILGKDGWDITSNLFVNGVTKTNKITLTGGYSLECSGIHPVWSSPDNGNGWMLKKKIGWRKSAELQEGDWVALKSGARVFGQPTGLSLDRAYLYGLYIAEGSSELSGRSNRITITNQSPEIIAFLKDKFGFHNTDGIHNRKNSKELVAEMRDFGVPLTKKCFEKFIPPKLFLQPEDVQVAFLQGLYDGDGHSTTLGNNLAVALTSTSKRQLHEVQQMLLNFGIIAHLNMTHHKAHTSSVGYVGASDSYTLKTTGNDSNRFMAAIGFRLPYKNKPHAAVAWNRPVYQGFVWVRIKTIEQGECPTVDFTIPETQSFLSNGIVSHNTPQTNEDFFFDKTMQKRFATWITPAVVSDAKRQALWPEWKSYDDLMVEKEAMGESLFNQEYNAMPVYSENSFLDKEKLIPLCTEVCMDFMFYDKFDNLEVVAGFDIGQKVHPSHLAVFVVTENYDAHDNRIQNFRMVYQKWMDGWSYNEQINFLDNAVENFNIKRLNYDDTRGEFKALAEQGRLPAAMNPISFGGKFKSASAALIQTAVETERIKLIDEPRYINQLLAVTGDLDAMTSPEGHGDSFWSTALALYDPKAVNRRNPRVRSLYD